MGQFLLHKAAGIGDICRVPCKAVALWIDQDAVLSLAFEHKEAGTDMAVPLVLLRIKLLYEIVVGKRALNKPGKCCVR